MAAGGFSSPGSSSSSSAAAEVEALIAEAADLVALEQIARLNSSHLSDDALLPADVESRFRRLKTFPAPFQKGRGAHARPPAAEQPPAVEEPEEPKLSESDPAVDKDAIFTSSAATISPVKSDGADGSERRPGNGLLPSPLISPASSSRLSRCGSPSPPRGRACCFGLSPRKGDSRKKGGKGRGGDVGFRKGDDYGFLLSDLDTFSLREQRRSMRRATREEEKVVQEAQRMVKWVKQASARMEVSAATVDELLSDIEDEGKSK